jgi:hypothetical protein
MMDHMDWAGAEDEAVGVAEGGAEDEVVGVAEVEAVDEVGDEVVGWGLPKHRFPNRSIGLVRCARI